MQKQVSQSCLRNKYKIDINEFQILKKIMESGFSHVYLVSHKENRQLYAAKVIHYSKEKDNYKQLINREISIMMRIHHPTLIKFYGYSLIDFEGNKNITIIMELAKNGSLSDFIQKSQKGLADLDYDNTKRQNILIGIARGMMFLHQNHVLHRDLKPSNILLDENLHPHIIDFGLSKFYEQGKTKTTTNQCGTTIYMAPETIKDNIYNIKTDVYSFGILMFEVVTEQIPYPEFQNDEISLYQFQYDVVENNLRPTFKVPIKESIKELIEKCWSKNPNERPTFEELFNKLALNDDEWIIDVVDGKETENEYDTAKYFLKDVDSDEILDYVDSIRETSMIEVLINENNELKRQIESVNKTLQNKEKEIEHIKLEFEKIKKAVEEKKIQQIKNSIKEQSKQIESIIIEITKMKKEQEQIIKDSVDYVYDKKINSIDELRNEISKLQIEFASKNEKIKRDNECKKNRLKRIEDQFFEISKKYDNLSQLTNATETKFYLKAKDNDDRIQILENTIEKLNNECKKLKKVTNEQKQQNFPLQDEMTRFESTESFKQNEIKQLYSLKVKVQQILDNPFDYLDFKSTKQNGIEINFKSPVFKQYEEKQKSLRRFTDLVFLLDEQIHSLIMEFKNKASSISRKAKKDGRNQRLVVVELNFIETELNKMENRLAKLD